MSRGGRVCAACEHPEREQIDVDLAGGESQRAIGRRYGISEGSIRRHRRNHRNEALATLTRTRKSTVAKEADGMGDGLWALLDRTEAFLISAEHSGDAVKAMAAIREMRNIWELWGRATGALKERPPIVVNVQQTAQWVPVREVVYEIMARHPEDLAELDARLKALEDKEDD